MKLIYTYNTTSDHAFTGRELEQDDYQPGAGETALVPSATGENYFDGSGWVDRLTTVYLADGSAKQVPKNYTLAEGESFEQPKPKPVVPKPSIEQQLIMQQQAKTASLASSKKQLQQTSMQQQSTMAQLQQLAMQQEEAIARMKEGM